MRIRSCTGAKRPVLNARAAEETASSTCFAVPRGTVSTALPSYGSSTLIVSLVFKTHLNLLRRVSPRTIKENFAPPVDFTYPHMGG